MVNMVVEYCASPAVMGRPGGLPGKRLTQERRIVAPLRCTHPLLHLALQTAASCPLWRWRCCQCWRCCCRRWLGVVGGLVGVVGGWGVVVGWGGLLVFVGFMWRGWLGVWEGWGVVVACVVSALRLAWLWCRSNVSIVAYACDDG